MIKERNLFSQDCFSTAHIFLAGKGCKLYWEHVFMGRHKSDTSGFNIYPKIAVLYWFFLFFLKCRNTFRITCESTLKPTCDLQPCGYLYGVLCEETFEWAHTTNYTMFILGKFLRIHVFTSFSMFRSYCGRSSKERGSTQHNIQIWLKQQMRLVIIQAS